MKFSSEVIKEAHKLTKEIKAEYPEVNYKFQFGISRQSRNCSLLCSKTRTIKNSLNKNMVCG
ncbi:hypothetical protein [Clostridium sp.]|jgi:hypothetical protein|uniref:hypothetical protein n=1 Tax=Clostridium sp. TaxID=1506 RepID=UPI003A375A23